VQPQLAVVLALRPGQDLDEGRLAGPVLAEQAVDLAPAQLEIEVRQRLGAAEALRDATKPEDGLGDGWVGRPVAAPGLRVR
jgi:hypothetical protein